MTNIDFDNFNSIKIFTDVFTEDQNNKIWEEYLYQGKWKYGHKSFPNSNNKFWYNELIDEDFFVEELFLTIKNLIGNNFKILKCYANGHTAFQDGDFHTDSEETDEYTFLYYPMNDWSLEWNGETVFLLPSGELQYILPIPNGAVLFPGSWMHCGKAPSSKLPCGLRTTIAYKLKKVNEFIE
jgi:hypothetical protein